MTKPRLSCGSDIDSVAAVLLLLERTERNRPILLAAYYILSAYTAATPTLLNWQSTNVAGHTKKTCVSICTSLCMFESHCIRQRRSWRPAGSVVAWFVWYNNKKPMFTIVLRSGRFSFHLKMAHVITRVFCKGIRQYIMFTLLTGLLGLLIAFCIFSAFICITVVYLHYLNFRNEQRRITAGKGGRSAWRKFIAKTSAMKRQESLIIRWCRFKRSITCEWKIISDKMHSTTRQTCKMTNSL